MASLESSWASLSVGFTKQSTYAPAPGAFRPSFVTFASQVHCDAAHSPSTSIDSYNRFYAAFNPKYDLKRPSHMDYLTFSNFAFVVTRSVLLRLYFDQVASLNDKMDGRDSDNGDDVAPDLFDTAVIVPGIRLGAVQGLIEVVQSIFRIAYEKLVYDHWETRTKWKFLKGAPAWQS